MICGPEVMMRFAAKGLQERGLGSDSIWLSLERNMHCGTGVCGHCQLGPVLVCRDGPVFRLSEIEHLLAVREL
jgi:NAD(P)H-flavin reductase